MHLYYRVKRSTRVREQSDTMKTSYEDIVSPVSQRFHDTRHDITQHIQIWSQMTRKSVAFTDFIQSDLQKQKDIMFLHFSHLH